MFSVKLFVFFALLFVRASGSSFESPRLGYLVVNGSRTPHCYDLKKNDVCPPDLVNYQIIAFDQSQEIVEYELQPVRLNLKILDLFQVSDACRASIREYSCSNMFAVCTTGGKYGVNLRYDFAKTERACASVQANCPELVAYATTYNCSIIQKDASAYAYCTSLPDVPGDICAKSNYKYPAAMGQFYKVVAKDFPKNLAQLVKDKVFVSEECVKEFVNVQCQMLRGTICSSTLRLYAISRQDCAKIFSKCISTKIPKLQDFFLETCKLFPDANTAKRVPLPPDAISNGVEN